MAKNYIPRPHNRFNTWQKQLVKGLLTDPVKNKVVAFPPAPGANPANWDSWKMPEENMQELVDAQAKYQPLYDKWSDEDARNHDKVEAHVEGRKTYEKFLRKFIARWLRHNKRLNNAAKAGLGLTVPDEKPTAVTPVDHGPRLAIDTIRQGLHKIRITDPETPDSKAMPEGHKLVLERFIGGAGLKAGDIGWKVYKQTGKFLVNSEFTDEDKNKTAYYRSRYVTTRGDFTVYGNTLKVGIV